MSARFAGAGARMLGFLGALALASCGGKQGTEQAGPGGSAEQAAGWRPLFDGETTAGWRGYNRETFPETGWAVIDGALVVGTAEGEADVPAGGDIVTVEEFADFELVFDFKVSPVANSGVFYRVQESAEHGIWELAPEFQVLDDPAYLAMPDMEMETHLSGDNYDLHASRVRALRPTGEWNEGRILVRGDHVEHWLNGQKTVEYELRSPEWEALVAASKFAPYPEYGRAASGPIGLQDHGRQVWYRNIKIRQP